MVAMIVGTVLHLPLCYLFVYVLDMDIQGLGLASTCKDFVILATVMIYGNCSEKIRTCLRTPDRESFTGWSEYLKIAVPSMAMICSEQWAFNILTIIAGTLGVVEQGTLATVVTISSTMFMIPIGI